MSIASEIERIQNAKTSIKTAIENKGVEVGNGTIDTYASKINEISVGSSDSYYDTFWDAYQVKGERYNYNYAFQCIVAPKAENYKFYGHWNEISFQPKYDIKPTTATEMLVNFKHSSGEPMDLEQHLKDCGISIDMSNATSVQRAFSGHFSVIPEIVCSDNLASFDRVFYSCSDIETIRKITVGENTVFNNSFYNCTGLKNITFGGTIGKNISFSGSPLLTNESIQSIIEHLADLTGQTSQTLTLHADVKAKLTEEQIASITSKNWTLA